MNTIQFLLIIFMVKSAFGLIYNYYWREYVNGTVPKDAVIGGEDVNGNKIYIGQGCVKDYGLFIGEIQAGKMQLLVPIRGVKNVTTGIKILCKPSQTIFQWMPTDATNLHLIEDHVVIGGLQFGHFTNIGRIFHQQKTQIGKVNSFNLNNAKLYFINGNHELTTPKYQVLTSNQNTLNNQLEVHTDGYYWREYNGYVPNDAFSAGMGENNLTVYIGQVFVQNEGIIGTEIQLGKKQVQVPVRGVKNATTGIKILCTRHQEAFRWIATNATSVSAIVSDPAHEPLIGGVENEEIAHIGRVTYKGYEKVGKINTFILPQHFYAVDGNEEIFNATYEILTFNRTMEYHRFVQYD